MYYGYEATVKVFFVTDNLGDVSTNKCEAYETLEDLPLHEYDYWCLPDYITKEDIRHRIREPYTPIYEKDPLTPPENTYGILTEE